MTEGEDVRLDITKNYFKMNINRDNYESFFLLYTDNELSGAERKGVDLFVVANPDLLEELKMLQQSVLFPDNIGFDFKQSLLKTELLSSELEEKLLLYLDNELSSKEKNEIEQLIKKEAGVEKKWSDVRVAKLEADKTVIFKNKELLYRKESGRLLVFSWRKLSAAAILIGFSIWGGLQYLKNDPKANAGEFAIKENKETPAGIVQQPTQQIIDTASVVSVKGDIIAVSNKSNIPMPSTSDNVTKAVTAKSYRGNSVESNDEKIIAATQPKDNYLPTPYSENLNNVSGNNTIAATVTPLKQPNTSIDPVQKQVTNNTVKQDAAIEYVSVASFTESSEESSNHVLFMDEEKVKKTKIGGFFRKVKRVVERTTNIKTGGNNFKVANLEFAIQ